MKKVDGEWVAEVFLGRGKHRYKFVVDGESIIDPQNPLWEENDTGPKNSIVWIE